MTDAPARQIQGTPCWVSLMVHDLPQAQEFYGGLFGWEFQPGPRHFGPYVRAVVNGRLAAGIGEIPREWQLPIRWTTYLRCDDADATAERIRECGGTVGVGPLDADLEAGRLAIASDPDGAVFGVWQPKVHPGIGAWGVPGTLAWSELVTRDSVAAGKFYAAVLGYDTHAELSADRDHTTLRLDGRPVAGIHGIAGALPHDPGAHWLAHFAVADPDEAARRATRLGGRVLEGPYDGPLGRTATVADPEGALFRLVHPVG